MPFVVEVDLVSTRHLLREQKDAAGSSEKLLSLVPLRLAW